MKILSNFSFFYFIFNILHHCKQITIQIILLVSSFWILIINFFNNRFEIFLITSCLIFLTPENFCFIHYFSSTLLCLFHRLKFFICFSSHFQSLIIHMLFVKFLFKLFNILVILLV